MDRQKLVRNGEGKDYDYSQDHCFIKLSSRETGGRLSMVEDQLKPGFRLARHYHKKMTEVFYLLEGEVDFIFDDDTVTLGPGDTLTVPPKTWHAAECKDGGRMLTVFLEGQFDQYLERLSSLTEEEFGDASLMKSIAEQFDNYEE